MTKLEAIWASVGHWLDLWERVAAGEVLLPMDIEGNECACCEYNDEMYKESGRFNGKCDHCPVKRYTGKNNCLSTPWQDVSNLIEEMVYVRNDITLDKDKNIELLLDLVEKEYQFLVDVALSRTVLCRTL